MRIVRARLRDAPALAWIAAQAFAAETGTANVRRRAQGQYLMHLCSLALLSWQGKLWQWDKRAVIVIERKKTLPSWKGIAAVGFYAVVAIGLLAWIPTADKHGRQLLLIILQTGGVLLTVVIVVLLLACIPAVKELHPRRSAHNADAIRQWKKTLPGRKFCKVSYLAIEHVVPAGAPLYTEARSDKLKAIYPHRGFHCLATADGKPTLAMGSPAGQDLV